MLVKFIPTGTTKKGKTGRTGGGQAAQDYLLGKDFEKGIVRDGATLLRGNPSRTTEIINGIKNQNAYKSGVISFSKEEKPTPEQLESVMDGLENTLFPNLDKDRYSCYWVHHQDKDRDELHFIIAETDLKTAKSLAVYYAPNDKKLIESWAKLTIEQHEFIDPNDPNHKRTKTQTTRNERDNALKDIIEERLLAVIEKDESIKTRDDIIEVIKGLGYEINRSTAPDSISIKNPNGKRPLKFKDGIYTKDFDRSQLPSHRKQAKIQYDKDHDNRIAKYKEQYEYSLALREKRLLKRIGTVDRTPHSKELSAKLDQIRAESEPNFLKQVAEYQRQELKKIIGQTIEQIYKQHEHDQPEQLTALKNLHQTLLDNIDSQIQDEPLPQFDQVIADYQNSKNHIVTFDHIEHDRHQAQLEQQQAELARQQAELEFKANIQSQLDYMLSKVGEVLPQTNYIKWQSLSDSDLADYLTDYQRQGQALLDKAHNQILDPQELQNDKIIKDVITTINDVIANRERDRLEQLRAEQAKIKFDNQIKAQLDTLASITGQVTKSFYDSLRYYDPQQLAQMKAMHTNLSKRLLETAGRELSYDIDSDLDKFTHSKNILATIDHISLEREKAQEQARIAEQKRLADMVNKPPVVTPKPQDKPSAPTTLTQQTKPPVERVSVADDRNARLAQAQKIIADFDKLVKDNAQKLKIATINDRTKKFNEASKALSDLGSKPLFRGKDQWEIDNKKLTLKKRNAEISLDQAKGDIEKLKAWNFELELFREKELQPINYTAIALERLDKSVKDKVQQAHDVIEQINDEINREKARTLGADKLAKTGEVYRGKVIKVNENGAYQQTQQAVVLHPTYANQLNEFKAEQSYDLDYRSQGKVLKSETYEIHISGNSKDINIDGNKGR